MSEVYDFEFHKIQIVICTFDDRELMSTDAIYFPSDNRAQGKIISPNGFPRITALRAAVVPLKSGIIELRKSIKLTDAIAMLPGDELEAAYTFEDDFFQHMLAKEECERQKFHSIIKRKTLIFDKEI